MSETEQNKRINQFRRQLANAVERIKTLELDLEPEGRITEAFSVLENHIDSKFEQIDSKFEQIDSRLDRMEHQFNSRLDRMEHQFNRLQAKLEVILDMITGLTDLPEDETQGN